MNSNPNWKPKKLIVDVNGKPITGLFNRRNGDLWKVKNGRPVKFIFNMKIK